MIDFFYVSCVGKTIYKLTISKTLYMGWILHINLTRSLLFHKTVNTTDTAATSL